MEYKLIKRDEAFKKLLDNISIDDTIYVVCVSRSKEFDDQWVRFYYINTDSEMEDITAEIATLFEFDMVYGEPATHITGGSDEQLIGIVEQLSELLFDVSIALEFCRL